MAVQNVRSFVYHPNGSGEVWCIEGNTRRHVFGDELGVWLLFGGTVGSMPSGWFNSYPVTGA